MIPLTNEFESHRDTQIACLSVAAMAHMALVLWNPVMFREAWKTITTTGEGPVVIVVEPGPETTRFPGLPETTSTRPSSSGLTHSHFPSVKPKLHTLPPVPPLAAKPYRPTPLTHLPFQTEEPMSGTSTPIPIAIETGKKPSITPIAPLPLTERQTHAPSSWSIGGALSHSEERGSGRILIRHEQPLPAPVVAEISSPQQQTRAKSGSIIDGPLSNRHVLHRIIPTYPQWAEEQGIMGVVRIYFTVGQDGLVRSNLRIDKTTGNQELDRLAIDALRQWRFSATANDDGHQWGVITFTFSLIRE